MDINAYADLLNIILKGMTDTLNLQTVVGFVIALFFIYASVSKDGKSDKPLSDISWVGCSALVSFILSSVGFLQFQHLLRL